MEWAGIARAALAVLSDERGRKAVGWIVVAALSPLIVAAVLLLSIASGAASHNNAVVYACFYGGSFSESAPAEYQAHISAMRESFSSLDSAVSAVNDETEENGLDPNRVKAVFYTLCFGEGLSGDVSPERFVDCFYRSETRTRLVTVTDEESGEADVEAETVEEPETTEEPAPVEEEYTVNIPLPLSEVYANLAALLGREITDADIQNAAHIYRMVSGDLGGGAYDGGCERGGGVSAEINVSGFADPTTKNAHDLVAYATQAWENGWGYVWGSFGNVLTEGSLSWMLEAYPDGVGSYEEFIRDNWLGGRTTDCVGLIKGYGWLDAEALAIRYDTNGMPDIGANQMYYSAVESGTINTMPDIPGLAVWHDGHIGVYIGGGEVIEAMGTKYGVVKTQLDGRGWTHWLKIPYIEYN